MGYGAVLDPDSGIRTDDLRTGMDDRFVWLGVPSNDKQHLFETKNRERLSRSHRLPTRRCYSEPVRTLVWKSPGTMRQRGRHYQEIATSG